MTFFLGMMVGVVLGAVLTVVILAASKRADAP